MRVSDLSRLSARQGEIVRGRARVNGDLREVMLPSSIPDSAIHQYDASEDTQNTGGINSVPDLIGNADLSGGASLISDGINSKQSYRLDGVDDELSTTDVDQSIPVVVLAVLVNQEDDPTTQNGAVWSRDGDGAGDDMFLWDGGDNTDQWSLRDGGREESAIEGGTVDGNATILTSFMDGGGGLRIEQDGTEVANGSPGEGNGLNAINIGKRGGDQNDLFLEMDLGELLIYEDPTDDEISDETQRVSDKWGITI